MCWFVTEKVTVNLQEMGRPDGAQPAAWQGASRVICPFKVINYSDTIDNNYMLCN